MSTAQQQPSKPTDTASPGRSVRRHDLDALRGFAMVLGIALHASMSFFTGFWVVQDVTADDDSYFDEFFHAVHGFRMPLFFLLSGFFTAMLWRRRGLGELLIQRLKRIALPLAIGLVTIVPAVNWSIDWAIDNGVEDYIDESGDIWAAVFVGNGPAVEELLVRGVDVNAPNPSEGGDRPLHVAAFVGDVDMVELLLANGADPNLRAPGGLPVEYAVFVGSDPVAQRLVDAGSVDPRAGGEEWEELSYWAEGEAEAERAEAKFGLASWLTSLHHLWFLWFLLWLVAGFAVIAFTLDRVRWISAAVRSWSPLLMWALVPIAVVPQLRMGNGGDIPVFGPDTSTGWLPIWHVLGYYAVFFAFGSFLFGQKDRNGEPLVGSLGRWWPVLLPLAFFVVLPVGLHLTFGTDTAWPLVSMVQVGYAWLAIVALLGLFRALLGVERRGVRYLSDSAYWLYLAHLPIVVIAQSWIRHWDLPATVKFLGLTTAVTIVLLMSYQLFVRYTALGTLLNGKRIRPGQR
ncbi:MAG: acyltransferase family protein [Acidimicrobiales bacterium]